MYRTQIMLEEKQYEFLKRLSQGKKKSMSRVLREILDSYSKKTKNFPLMSISGIGDDPFVSGRDHDKWLYGKK